MERGRIRGFDGLRAVSVILVILSHLTILGWIASASPLAGNVISIFDADFGVRTFFVLSGFLITRLLIAEHSTTGTISLSAFVLRRAARILPLYFLIVTLAVALVALHLARPAWTATLFSAFYIYNYLPRAHEVNYLNHLWSLAVEEQFYLFWPAAFFLVFSKSRAMINVLALGLIVACLWRIHSGYGSASEAFEPSIWTIPAILPIIVGCLIALNIDALTSFLSTPACLVGSIILVGAPLYVQSLAVQAAFNAFGTGGLIGWIYLNQSSRLVDLLEVRAVAYLGTISYGLYMWQGFLTGNGPYRDAAWPPNMWIGALLTLPTAAISYRYFERPIRKIAARHGAVAPRSVRFVAGPPES
jgi:peptidoglycan/LPS O-acetylase OafA/YrhL